MFEAIEALFEEGGCRGGWGFDRPVDEIFDVEVFKGGSVSEAGEFLFFGFWFGGFGGMEEERGFWVGRRGFGRGAGSAPVRMRGIWCWGLELGGGFFAAAGDFVGEEVFGHEGVGEDGFGL